jgi:hypothetical protein
MGRLRFIDFEDFKSVAVHVRDLAMTPFVETEWQSLFSKFNWRWSSEPSLFAGKGGRTLLLPQSQSRSGLLDEAGGAGGEPEAIVSFNAPEFKLLAAYSWCENLSEARARSRFTDAFAKLQFEASEAIGPPDHRIHFVEDGFPKLVFNACVWTFAHNDLYFMQDLGDMHGGESAIVTFRILPRRDQPTDFPFRAALDA